MARRLNTFVHVHQDGESFAFGPGETIPGALAELITNPDVWDDEPETVAVAATVVSTSTVSSDASSDETVDDDPEPGGIPPKSGKGSGVPAWRAYADANGFETDDDVTRDEIIAALTAAGIPTEK